MCVCVSVGACAGELNSRQVGSSPVLMWGCWARCKGGGEGGGGKHAGLTPELWERGGSGQAQREAGRQFIVEIERWEGAMQMGCGPGGGPAVPCVPTGGGDCCGGVAAINHAQIQANLNGGHRMHSLSLPPSPPCRASKRRWRCWCTKMTWRPSSRRMPRWPPCTRSCELRPRGWTAADVGWPTFCEPERLHCNNQPRPALPAPARVPRLFQRCSDHCLDARVCPMGRTKEGWRAASPAPWPSQLCACA